MLCGALVERTLDMSFTWLNTRTHLFLRILVSVPFRFSCHCCHPSVSFHSVFRAAFFLFFLFFSVYSHFTCFAILRSPTLLLLKAMALSCSRFIGITRHNFMRLSVSTPPPTYADSFFVFPSVPLYEMATLRLPLTLRREPQPCLHRSAPPRR